MSKSERRACVHASHVVPFMSDSLPPHALQPCQAPLSMVFSRQEYCTGLLCPPPGYLPDPGVEPMSLTPSALAGSFFTTRVTWEAHSPQSCFTWHFSPLLGLISIPLCLAPRRLIYGRHGYHLIQKHLQFSSVQFSRSVMSDSL